MGQTRSAAFLVILLLAACTRATPPTAVTSDVCTGATDRGARQRFTLEQITPCLHTVSEVSDFMRNNVTYDIDYDFREHGGNEYAPASVVYERGIDDGDGFAILQCYFLEENGWDAFVIGLSVDSPIGSNVCGVIADEGLITLEGEGQMAGSFNSIADAAEYYISIDWMQDGGSLRTLKASQVTQITTDNTTPSVLELPWVSHPY